MVGLGGAHLDILIPLGRGGDLLLTCAKYSWSPGIDAVIFHSYVSNTVVTLELWMLQASDPTIGEP